MLKLLFICLSTCISMNYPLESSFILFMFMMVMFNTNSIIYYNSMMDSLNCNLVLLSYFVILLCMMTNSTMSQTKKYLLCNSMLLLLLISSFFSKSLLTFFMLFEASLMPLFILMLGWGYQPERLQSSMYFLFYTLFGSLPLLVTLMFFSQLSMTSWVNKMINLDLVIYCCLMFAFLVKMPMFLVHLWLPKAHVEAPTMGSMILAGITLKLGSYALLRLLSITENFTLKFNWIWMSISAMGNLLLCFVCLRQMDLKSLMAYSSVIHMGLCLLTILFLLKWSFEGGLWLSLSHGLASSGLFFLTNSTYLRFNSRSLYMNKGLAFTLPLMSLWLFMLLMFNMASPPSLNLFSEIKMVATTVSISWFLLIMSAISSFFCAAYCLFLFNNLFHGKHNNTQKFSNTIIMNEHLVLFYHLWPLIMSALILYFIQWNK